MQAVPLGCVDGVARYLGTFGSLIRLTGHVTQRFCTFKIQTIAPHFYQAADSSLGALENASKSVLDAVHRQCSKYKSRRGSTVPVTAHRKARIMDSSYYNSISSFEEYGPKSYRCEYPRTCKLCNPFGFDEHDLAEYDAYIRAFEGGVEESRTPSNQSPSAGKTTRFQTGDSPVSIPSPCRDIDASYTYDALTTPHHIRVLVLAPSEDVDAALECSIRQGHINDPHTEYEAISYTWGDQGRTERLICDGEMIAITPNLASALLCLRHRTRPRGLWADAVCINQGDLVEKSQQIPLMARIYRSATQVRVWLGDGNEGESRTLHDLASLQKVTGHTSSSLNHPLAPKSHDQKTNQTLVDIGRAAKSLLRMPWFGRRWVVQELVLNGNVVFHCGKSQISWQALHFAFHTLPDDIWDDQFDTQIRRKLVQLRQLWRTWCYANEFPMDCSIYSLLRSFHDLQCKEPKDRIYAIAGLADDVELQLRPSPRPSGIASVIPNYEATDEVVFQDLAFKMIQSGKVFSTLAHAGASRIDGAKQLLPSWVPDVRKSGLWPLMMTQETEDFNLIEACQPSTGVLKLQLMVYGWQHNRAASKAAHLAKTGYTQSKPWHLNSSTLDWRLVSVGAVFEPPKNWFEQDALKLKLEMDQWLIHHQLDPHYKTDDERSTYEAKARHISMDMDYLLWCVVRNYLLAEDGFEPPDRLPSRREWLSQSIKRDGQWLRYLPKALSKSTLFIEERQDGIRTPVPYRLWGFGPRNLKLCDVLFPSSFEEEKLMPALFLRPASAGCTVLGAGIAWPFRSLDCIANVFYDARLLLARFTPRKIKVRLI